MKNKNDPTSKSFSFSFLLSKFYSHSDSYSYAPCERGMDDAATFGQGIAHPPAARARRHTMRHRPSRGLDQVTRMYRACSWHVEQQCTLSMFSERVWAGDHEDTRDHAHATRTGRAWTCGKQPPASKLPSRFGLARTTAEGVGGLRLTLSTVVVPYRKWILSILLFRLLIISAVVVRL